MTGYKFHEIEIGQSASYSKTITETDVYMFAGISGDNNPVHIDEVYAKSSIFKKRVAHGILTAGLISTVLGTKLPGPGSIYAKQDLKFLAPVYFNDTITATCTAKEKIEEKSMIVFECKVTNQENKTVLVGDATIVVPK